jgi:protein phosphatase
LFFAHVGDSRLYRYRGGQLRQLTRDHSLIQQLVDEGLFADRREAQGAGVGDNILLRSLGLEARVEPDVGDARIEPGDLYLFCTDGLAGKVPDRDIAALLADADEDLDLLAERLKQAALDVGGPDNVTLILARPRL